MRTINMSKSLTALLIATSFSVSVYAQDPAAIQKKLVSEYALTQPTAANDDIVTAGAVLVLEKSNIMMAPVSSTNLYQNTYQNGKISQNAIGKGIKALSRWNHLPGASQQNTPDTRTFVAGEKIWVTGINVRPDGVVFDLFTDAINNGTADVRYKASLKFPFKGSIPPEDQVDKLVAEVFKVQPADDAKADPKQAAPGADQAAAPANTAPAQAAAPAPAPAAEAAPPPIAPPPPPPADPKTIALKQTKDQVVANFGQPDKIINLGAKQIYVYKDMKVTFVAGKVTDVQ